MNSRREQELAMGLLDWLLCQKVEVLAEAYT